MGVLPSTSLQAWSMVVASLLPPPPLKSELPLKTVPAEDGDISPSWNAVAISRISPLEPLGPHSSTSTAACLKKWSTSLSFATRMAPASGRGISLNKGSSSTPAEQASEGTPPVLEGAAALPTRALARVEGEPRRARLGDPRPPRSPAPGDVTRKGSHLPARRQAARARRQALPCGRIVPSSADRKGGAAYAGGLADQWLRRSGGRVRSSPGSLGVRRPV
mmetsp:Transcript_3562/g.8984  ORF Transcript_3562/g.8984 Transcript_3562/m.8984 type:complete len:220 (+) Transcript_3562:822-1481(+)